MRLRRESSDVKLVLGHEPVVILPKNMPAENFIGAIVEGNMMDDAGRMTRIYSVVTGVSEYANISLADNSMFSGYIVYIAIPDMPSDVKFVYNPEFGFFGLAQEVYNAIHAKDESESDVPTGD